MKIMITGAGGQLGKELQRQLAAGGSALGPLPQRLALASVMPVDIDDADLSNRHDTAILVRRHAPDAVIHCAAYTNVDGCEENPDEAFRANAIAARNVAMVCEEVGARMVHVSTDYVFSGNAVSPVDETALPAPQSVYGHTKLLGETYVKHFCSRWFVVRTAWLYGRAGNNFVKTILRLARKNGKVDVVDDQRGNPTNAEDLAHHLLKLVPTKEYGTYHCTGGGICTWYDFAKEIVQLWGIEAQVLPTTTDAFPRPAKRPAYSALGHAMLRATVGDEMRPWQQALAAFHEEMKDKI